MVCMSERWQVSSKSQVYNHNGSRYDIDTILSEDPRNGAPQPSKKVCRLKLPSPLHHVHGGRVFSTPGSSGTRTSTHAISLRCSMYLRPITSHFVVFLYIPLTVSARICTGWVPRLYWSDSRSRQAGKHHTIIPPY